MPVNPAEPSAERDPGPALVTASMHLATPASPGVGVVVSTERCTASTKSASIVRHVAIDVGGTPLAGRFVAGQSFGVIPPGTDAQGRPHKLRLYSIASPSWGEDGAGRVLSTTVKRTIDEHHETHRLFTGVCSNYLCDLQVGDKVVVTGPSGKRFVLPQNPGEHDYVFLATGTGIAPFRGMVMELLGLGAGGRSAAGSKVTLIAGAAYGTDLLYDRQFKEWARAHAGFEYLTAVSREEGKDGRAYVHQRLERAWERVSGLLESPRTLVYICGIAGMELGVLQVLAKRLGPGALGRLVKADAAVAGNPEGWTRADIPRLVQPTRRMFIEVYD